MDLSISKSRVDLLIRVLLLLNIVFIVLTDTSALHKLSLVGQGVWALIASITLLPVMVYVYRTTEEPIVLLAMVFAYVLGVANILDIPSSNIIFRVSLLVLNIIIVYYLFTKLDRKEHLLTTYFALITVVTLDLLIQIFTITTIYISLVVEILVLGALLIALRNYQLIDVIIIAVVGIIGAVLGQFVLGLPLPTTIVRTLISQILGINSGSILAVSGDIFFMLHLAEIAAYTTALLIKKKYNLLFLLLTGISMSFVPLVLIRIYLLADIFQTNKNIDNAEE